MFSLDRIARSSLTVVKVKCNADKIKGGHKAESREVRFRCGHRDKDDYLYPAVYDGYEPWQ